MGNKVGTDAIMAKGVLEIINEAVFKFRAALTQRGMLTRSSNYGYFLEEVEYPFGRTASLF